MKRLVAAFALLLFVFPLIALAQSALTVTTTSLPPASVGVSYSVQLQATGGVAPYTWAISSGVLPGGLSLSSGGLISGNPTSGGAFNITVTVTSSGGGGGTGGSSGPIVCTQGCATPALANWNNGPNSVSLPSAVAPGDVVVLMVEGLVPGAAFTIRPSSGTDTFTPLVTAQTSDTFQHWTIFYACNSSGGYKTVNGAWSGDNYGTVALLDLSGPASFCVDGPGIANAGTGGAPSVGPFTPTVTNDFFFAILFNPYGNVIAPTWPGATSLGMGSYGNAIFVILNSAGATPQTASGNVFSTNWAAVMGAVKP
jgi:hypothetical protein